MLGDKHIYYEMEYVSEAGEVLEDNPLEFEISLRLGLVIEPISTEMEDDFLYYD